MVKLIESNLSKIKAICVKHSVEELYLFGSAATGNFTSASDLDFVVVFSDKLNPIEHGEAFFNLKDDLEELFKLPVDLLTYRALKNPIFRAELDNQKVVLYAA